MKKNLIVFWCLSFFVVFLNNVEAQNVTVNVEIDSFQRLIGEQAKITLEVITDSDSKVVLPNFEKELVDGVEIIHKSQPDTLYLNDKKRMEITEVYTVTSFDSSLYVIPPFEVVVNGNPFFSKELALAVYTMPVDTLNPDAFFGPKDIWRTKLTWDDFSDAFWFFVILLLSIAAFSWGLIGYITNKPIIRIIKIKPKLPSHVVALDEIEHIKGEEKWRVSGLSKEFYTKLTDVVRRYLNERFAFNATEMTTGEIMNNLLKIKEKDEVKDIEELLMMADLVKFAKFEPSINENDRHLFNVIEFVNRTKLLETEINSQPTEKKIVNKRSKRARLILLLTVIFLGVLAIIVLLLFIRELYYLLF